MTWRPSLYLVSAPYRVIGWRRDPDSGDYVAECDMEFRAATLSEALSRFFAGWFPKPSSQVTVYEYGEDEWGRHWSPMLEIDIDHAQELEY